MANVTNLNDFEVETDWYNSIFLDAIIPGGSWRRLPRLAQAWLRKYVGGTVLYFVSAFIRCFYAYYLKRDVYFTKGSIPPNKAMLLQIIATMKSMPWYVALPTFTEHMIENGWTKCFCNISAVGWLAYIAYVMIFLIINEFGIYWVHRKLHDIEPLYKYFHATHHIYNKQNTLSPFSGFAFNPLDGILQSAPHGIWTTNTHDTIHVKVWPFMGAGYHTVHHMTYHHNYGNFTIWMDWMLGTLCDPEQDLKKLK